MTGKKSLQCVFSVIFCIVFVLLTTAEVKASVLHSGTYNGVTWSIDSNGLLLLEGKATDYLFDAPWKQYKAKVKTADVNVTGGLKDLTAFFSGYKNLESVDFSDSDLSEVLGMACLFSEEYFGESSVGCDNLKTVIFGDVDTKKVISMASMFRGCKALTNVDMSGLDTDNVTDMEAMFSGCMALVSLDMSYLNTKNVSSMRDMFANCKSLKNINISGCDTSNVKSMYSMFYNCSSLTSLDLSGLETDNVTDMSNMFSECDALVTLDIKTFDTAKVELFDHMFYGCDSLASLDLSSFNFSALNMNWPDVYMFDECRTLKIIKMPANIQTDALFYFPEYDGYYWADSNGRAYTEAEVNLNVPMTYTKCKGTPPNGAKEGVTFSDEKTGGNYRVIFSGNKNKMPEVEYYAPINVDAKRIVIANYTTCRGVKYKITRIANETFSRRNRGKKLTQVKIGKNVTSIGKKAFYGCKKLKKVSIGKNVKTIENNAFANCVSLEKITLPANVSILGKNVFKNCKKLKSITINSKKLKKVGSGTLKGISEECRIVVPKNKIKKYKKLLKKKGQSNTVQIMSK